MPRDIWPAAAAIVGQNLSLSNLPMNVVHQSPEHQQRLAMGNSLDITACCSKVFIASLKLKAQHPCKTNHTPTIIHLLYIMPSFCPGPVLPNEKLQQILGHQPWRQNLSELQPRQPGCVPSKETIRNPALATSKSPASMSLSCSLEFCGR